MTFDADTFYSQRLNFNQLEGKQTLQDRQPNWGNPEHRDFSPIHRLTAFLEPLTYAPGARQLLSNDLRKITREGGGGGFNIFIPRFSRRVKIDAPVSFLPILKNVRSNLSTNAVHRRAVRDDHYDTFCELTLHNIYVLCFNWFVEFVIVSYRFANPLRNGGIEV